MNRIYQGRVAAVEYPNPDSVAAKERPWVDLPNWREALWRHHELFQDAVNYYTLALAALAQGAALDRAEGAAISAWRDQVRDNWCDGRRRAVPYEGPHQRLAAFLGVAAHMSEERQAFEASAAAILRPNGPSPADRMAALLQLLEEANATDLNQVAVNRLRWFCTRRGALSATPRDVVAKQEEERVRQARVIHEATLETLCAAARVLDPGRFVTQYPKDLLVGEDARHEALKQFRAAARKAPQLASGEDEFASHLAKLGDTLRVPSLGRKPSGLYPLALVLHLWPAPVAWEAFKGATRNLVTRELPKPTVDAIAAARGNDEPLFEYFTNRALVRDADCTTHAVWFEFDLAAFVEAIKSPHRFFQDTQTRAAVARGIREQLHRIEPNAGWLEAPGVGAGIKARGPAVADDEDTGPEFTFEGDHRIDRLRKLVTDPEELAGLAEPAEGMPAEYSIQERTLRGWSQLRDRWRRRAAQGSFTPDDLWADAAELQAEHRDDFGSAALFRALVRPENHCIWREGPPTPDRHAEDPLRAWSIYHELRCELADKERPIRFTPAHATRSPRYFIFPKTGRFGTKHESMPAGAASFGLTAGMVVATPRGLEPVAVRFAYRAPRLLRDQLRSPGEEDLSSADWCQPMVQALGIPAPDKQDFSKCRVTLQPSAPDDHQLTFPVEIDSSALKKALGGETWERQFNLHPEGEDFYHSSLRWPHEKQPAKPPEPWYRAHSEFTWLAIDLGQRDAGAYALLEARANRGFGERPARLIGTTEDPTAGDRQWRAAVVATGMLRLSGEDRLEWRAPSMRERAAGEAEFAWRQELHGGRGRSASVEETDACAQLLAALEEDASSLMPEGWRAELSFPEQNDKLLVAARRAQTRLSHLHRWAWFLADEARSDRIATAREEIAAANAAPVFERLRDQTARLSAHDTAGWRALVEQELARMQQTLPDLLVRIANRVLPLRQGSWRWTGHPDVPGCYVLDRQGPNLGNIWRRGQRGLSFRRIEQLEELRKRFQSLNHSLRRTVGGPAKPRRDESVPDPCPDLLEKLDRLKRQRVNQTAHLILAQALGVRLRAPGEEKARLRAERDQHGQYERFRQPVAFVVIEDLARYRAAQGRAPRENSRLMKWCHREIRDKLRELCEPFGLPVVETVAAWSSRFCSRSGVPGFRAVEVVAGFTRSGHWARQATKADPAGRLTEQAARLQELDRELCEAQRQLEQAWRGSGKPNACPQRTVLVPQAGGPIFVPLCGEIGAPEHPKLQPAVVQADVNAAINLGLRAVADPRLWRIHPRLRTSREADGRLTAREKRKYGSKKPPAISLFEEERPDAPSARQPNLFFDASGKVGWGHAETADPLTGGTVRLVLGVAMQKTIRDSEWRRCADINAARFARWRDAAADVPM